MTVTAQKTKSTSDRPKIPPTNIAQQSRTMVERNMTHT